MTGKVAVITGVNGPIGKAIAWRGATECARMLLADADEAAGKKVVQEVKQAGARVHWIHADPMTEEGARTIIHAGLKRFGRIDTMVHNVSVHPERSGKGADESGIDVDISGLFAMVFAGASAMRMQAEGNMVLTLFMQLDESGRLGSITQATAEAGFGGFVHASATELYPYGISVNGVELTDIHDETIRRDGGPSAHLAFLNTYRKASRFDDVARTACFLGSSDSRGITGQVLVVSGGHAPAHPRYALSPRDKQRLEEVYRRMFTTQVTADV